MGEIEDSRKRRLVVSTNYDATTYIIATSADYIPYEKWNASADSGVDDFRVYRSTRTSILTE